MPSISLNIMFMNRFRLIICGIVPFFFENVPANRVLSTIIGHLPDGKESRGTLLVDNCLFDICSLITLSCWTSVEVPRQTQI